MGKDNYETQFPVRCSLELRTKAEESAAAAGQSLVEWVRRAMQEKLTREEYPETQQLTLEQIDERIAKVITEKIDVAFAEKRSEYSKERN